jgi:hypothetical protein
MPKAKEVLETGRLEAWMRFNRPERPIRVFPARAENASNVEKWGVDRLPEDAPRQKRKVLITGSGRTGTHNMSKLLRAVGIDVGHEFMGEIGTSSHFFCADSDWYPFFPFVKGVDFGKAHAAQRQSDYLFENVIHVVRHPLLVIPSVEAKFGTMDYEFMEDNGIFPGPMTRTGNQKKRGYRGMMVWYWNNKYIEDHFPDAMRVRLEDLDKWWFTLVEMCGFPGVPKPQMPPSNKSRSLWYKPVHTADLDVIDPKLSRLIYEMAARYGYVMSDEYLKKT